MPIVVTIGGLKVAFVNNQFDATNFWVLVLFVLDGAGVLSSSLHEVKRSELTISRDSISLINFMVNYF
jgi:hypothetical protein